MMLLNKIFKFNADNGLKFSQSVKRDAYRFEVDVGVFYI